MSNPQLLVEINGEAGGLFVTLQQVVQRLDKLSQSARSAGDSGKQGMDTFTQALQRTATQSDTTAGSMFKVGASLMALRAALVELRGVGESVLQANLDMERSYRTLSMATGDGASAMAYVKRIAWDLGIDLKVASDGYSKMAAAARGTNLEGKASRDVFTAVMRAVAAMGLDAQKTEGILLALSQMMSKGRVMAEEMRKQLGEHLPGAFNIAARAMGVSTAQLSKLMETGQVVADDFLPKFARQLTMEMGDKPEKAANSLQGNINRIRSAFQLLSYEIGQGGASGGVSEALRGIADQLKSPAAMQGARELGSDLGSLAKTGAQVAKVLFEYRDVIIFLGEAYAATKLGQGISSLATGMRAQFQAAALGRVEMQKMAPAWVIANAQTRALADEEVRATAATMAHLQAARLKNAFSVSTSANSTIGLALEQQLKVAEDAHTLALQRQALAYRATGAAATAANVAKSVGTSIMGALGGPLGLITTMLTLGAAAWMMWGNSAEDAAKKAAQAREEAGRKSEEERMKTRDLAETGFNLLQVINKTTTSTKDKAVAQAQLKTVMEQLKLIHPELNELLKTEADLQTKAGEAIRLVTLDTKKKAIADREAAVAAIQKAKADIAAFEATAARARQEGKEFDQAGGLVLPGASVGFGGGAGTASWKQANEMQSKAEALKASIKDLESSYDKSLEIERKAIKDWNDLQEDYTSGGKGGTSKTSTNKDLVTAAESRARTEKLLAEAVSKETLSERENTEIMAIRAQRSKELNTLDDEITKGKFKRLGGEADAAKERAMIWYSSIEKIGAVERKFGAERVDLEAKVQAGLQAEEEAGLEKRLKTIQTTFQKLREDNAKLMHGGTPFLTDEQILRAEDAAKGRARIDQIREDLRKLKEEMSQEAEIKGGALSIQEQKDISGRYTQRGGTKAEAATLYGKEQHWGEGADKGAMVGIKNWLTQAQNAFNKWKQFAENILNGVSNGFANFFQNIFKHGMTAAQKWDALWQSISSSVTQALSKMAADELLHWGIQKAKEAWEEAARVKKIAGIGAEIAATNASTVASEADTGAKSSQAVAGFTAAHAGIPFVGWAMALGFIGLFLALMSSMKGRAVGGLVTKPEITLLGERGPEVVAPENDFRDWMTSTATMGARLAANIARNEMRVGGYQSSASGYARAAASAPRGQSRSASSDRPIHVEVKTGHILDTSNRGMQLLEETIVRAVSKGAAQSGFRFNANGRVAR